MSLLGHTMQDSKAITEMIYAAARKSGKRILLSRGWAELGTGVADRPGNVYLVGHCPHSWLFPKCSAAIHHGGAGTTAAALRAGIPSLVVRCPCCRVRCAHALFVAHRYPKHHSTVLGSPLRAKCIPHIHECIQVPFFGDQPFWGDCCLAAGVGPRPVPIGRLTLKELLAAFAAFQLPEVRDSAQHVAEKMRTENGRDAAVQHFHRHVFSSCGVLVLRLSASCELRFWSCVMSQVYFQCGSTD